jgi:hypothetical protein
MNKEQEVLINNLKTDIDFWGKPENRLDEPKRPTNFDINSFKLYQREVQNYLQQFRKNKILRKDYQNIKAGSEIIGCIRATLDSESGYYTGLSVGVDGFLGYITIPKYYFNE